MCSEMRGRSQAAQEAVSPIIGTLLVLAITVVGMAGIMLWGAPTIEAVQAQNAQVGVIGEFEELRSSSIDLSIPDASRIPTINVARGTIGLEPGTRLMVTANHSNCDLHVTGWADASVATVDFAAGGCSGTTFEVLQVVGSNTVRRYSGPVATTSVTIPAAAGFTPDVTQGDWMFRLSNGNDLSLVTYAQAWLVDNDALTWRLDTSRGGVSAFYDLGAVFSANGDAFFVEKGPSLQESEFGSGVFSFRMRTLNDTTGSAAISGRGSHEVFLGLVGNYARIDRADTYRLRFDMAGDLAESWCNLFIQRNTAIGATRYVEDGSLPCDQASDAAVRSVTYTVAGGGTVAFEAEVLHADIRVTLSV